MALLSHRYRSWTNPLSRFKKQTASKAPYVIEEPQEIQSTSTANKIHELKQYVRTTDMPPKLKEKLLSSKLSEVIHESDKLDGEQIKIVNSVFLELFKLNGRMVDNSDGDIFLSLGDLIRLFEISAWSLIAEHADGRQRLQIPKYMSILTQFLLSQNLHQLPPKTLVQLVELGSHNSSFEIVLSSLISLKSHFLTPEFTHELLHHYKKKGQLKLQIFESLVASLERAEVSGRLNSGTPLNTTNVDLSLHRSTSAIIDDQFYASFIEYVESLFIESLPEIHEYQNLERNTDRIQYVTNILLAHIRPDQTSLRSILGMVKLAYELSHVSENQQLEANILRVIAFVNRLPKETIKFELDLQEDETLAETLLVLSRSKNEQFLAEIITEYIQDNETSHEIKFQASLYEILSSDEEKPTETLLTNVVDLISSIQDSDIDPNEAYTRLSQGLMMMSIEPRGELFDRISNEFGSRFNYKASVLSYKYRIDKAVELQDHVAAISIFEDSLERSIDWVGEVEPKLLKTLNNLIILVCNKVEDVLSIFPIFVKIKQQMGGKQINADSILAMSSKMLQAEYVGDLIEMLKRELPQIDKDAVVKLPLAYPWSVKYKQLFEQLQSFVLEYNNEETHETNWVLYGELHKYFQVPFETYLPTMKFFCEKNRLNAALLIFRQVKKLNELHGDHSNLPPLKEMYMLLFQYFGDKLYEDGVIEIHESLKMDINLTKQDIALQNCILNAYSNLQDVSRARELFLSMSTSPKLIGGINEETIQIMIKTYTYNDLAYVQKFWNNLSQFGILPNRAIYRQYLIAHVYHGLVDDALALVEGMGDYDLEMDSELLISMHNYCLETGGQKHIREWAEENHQELWNSAVQSGLLTGATNYAPSNNLIAGS
ncbi:uncharacterized protein CANTADRAFT_24924 [Suhomyces tanzawaensis NRRL Y-17324]|uniref:Mitochondrial group I intron splicing factor CCM1 n=1 Tax=Suhomyces tanzawaensis NRRL Y-17324 TaxID=984487 RepID=A0A1E4SSA0_9ASCO|nr:uncharacterized protein CANTADRAFT_24924 [Suhomyces tanzawaensis NRRL Y-17324]ODV82393.1 hypothetical protein CANTADRAFT_24924 [Suhomyces tanzawaensis NRRL Y-17324]